MLQHSREGGGEKERKEHERCGLWSQDPGAQGHLSTEALTLMCSLLPSPLAPYWPNPTGRHRSQQSGCHPTVRTLGAGEEEEAALRGPRKVYMERDPGG